LQEQESVTDFRTAVVRGATERLVPILMTALAAGLALVPIALSAGEPGSEIQAPMEQMRAGSKAYLYYFVHEPPVARGQTNRGATHAAEIPYIFNNPVALWMDVDRALADAVSSYWVNVAANGNPNGIGHLVWPAFQPNANERLILGPKIELGAGLDAGRVDLFDAVAIRRSVGSYARQPS
jgi:hypothetical protein